VSLKDRAAIVGIGHTAYVRGTPNTEEQLALEAITAALDDAGVSPVSVDGMVKYSIETTSDVRLAQDLGIENLRFFSEVGYGGGGGCGTIVHAAAAIAAGLAETVICFRSRRRFGNRPWARTGQEVYDAAAFQAPFGLYSPVAQAAIHGRRHMIEFGTTSRQFGAFSVACRSHAARNPHALMREPITIEDHQASRMVADPLHLLDCCLEVDGACAVVVTSAARARDLRQPPAYILAAAQGTGPDCEPMTSYNRRAVMTTESAYAARDLYAMAGVGPADIDVAEIYDHFTPWAIMAIEDFGFCKKGEGGPFVASGATRWPDGSVPINTHGGSLSEAYIHGFNHVIEGVRQVRGSSTCQVENAELVLVSSASSVPTSALVLRR
jgi:acetyl-CoA acetyltransferase